MYYTAILLNSNRTFVENDAFDLDFIIYDKNNDSLTASDLLNYKFTCEITDGAQELKKKDANAGGSASQISTSGTIVTVHVDSTDTDSWNGEDYVVELQMEHLTTGDVHTVFKQSIKILEEELDW